MSQATNRRTVTIAETEEGKRAKAALERLTDKNSNAMGLVMELMTERLKQEQRYTRDVDNEHTAGEWVAIITARLSAGLEAYNGNSVPGHSMRDRVVEAGAMCIALLEVIDRNHL